MEFIDITDKHELSSHGYVRDKYTHKKLHVTPAGKLYLMCNGKTKAFRLHTEVAKHFVPNPRGYKYVLFKDNNPKNCHYSNLQWSAYRKEHKDHRSLYLLMHVTGWPYLFYSLPEAITTTGLSPNTLRSLIRGNSYQSGNWISIRFAVEVTEKLAKEIDTSFIDRDYRGDYHEINSRAS